MEEDTTWVYVTENPVTKSVVTIFLNREDAHEFVKNNIELYGTHAIIEQRPVLESLEEREPILTYDRDVVELHNND